jgi:NADH-quinone oxidoreductase subunit J
VNIELITFIILGIIAIASALTTITTRHPIYSALSLIVHFFALAGLYLTLQSPFIAVLQILVYAGAIMVLVIFVIMLLNLSEDEKMLVKFQARNSFGIALGAIFFIMVINIIISNTSNQNTANDVSQLFTPKGLGAAIYSNNLVAIELVGILLLAAIIGAIVMAKKKLID